ncbi:MAG: hypothetical protein ABSA90_06925 [Xanthobacteraceae bacterium]|jgi:hypothetical protein
MSTLAKEDVKKALAELRVNRPRHLADRTIRHILHRYGNGATNITELDPAYYGAVYAAAGGKPLFSSAQVAQQEFVGSQNCDPTSARPQTALVRDLERRLAAVRAKTKQSMPSGPVNLGDRSLPGDRADDAGEPQMPSGERLVR